MLDENKQSELVDELFLNKELVFCIFAQLDILEVINLGLTCKTLFTLAGKFLEPFFPYVSPSHFCIVNYSYFQEQSPGHVLNVVNKAKAIAEGSRLYGLIKMYCDRNPNRPLQAQVAFLEVYSEKYAIFNKSTRDNFRPTGLLLEPTAASWCPEVNDAWVLSHLHQNHAFRALVLPAHIYNFWDIAANRPTAIGRELVQLWRNGYRPVESFNIPNYQSKFAGTGIVMRFSGQRPFPPLTMNDVLEQGLYHSPTMRDALNIQSDEIAQVISAMGLAVPQVTIPYPGLGYRLICKHCNGAVKILWLYNQSTGRAELSYQCGNGMCSYRNGSFKLASNIAKNSNE